jgi:hypothetical protein
MPNDPKKIADGPMNMAHLNSKKEVVSIPMN